MLEGHQADYKSEIIADLPQSRIKTHKTAGRNILAFSSMSLCHVGDLGLTTAGAIFKSMPVTAWGNQFKHHFGIF